MMNDLMTKEQTSEQIYVENKIIFINHWNTIFSIWQILYIFLLPVYNLISKKYIFIYFLYKTCTRHSINYKISHMHYPIEPKLISLNKT